jgi:hypothetical protein
MGRWSFRGKSANLAASALAFTLLGASPTGGVYVTTLPAGADVWVDGTYLGRSPVVLDALTTGTHRLTLTRTGWSTQDVPVNVLPATTVTASVILVREGKLANGSGTIVFHGEQVGRVLVDGEPTPLAKDGTVAAGAGTHDVTIALPQGKITRTVTVYPQTRTDVVLLGEAETRSVVIAPADDYLPPGALVLDGTDLTVRYGHHVVVAHVGSVSYVVDGRSVTYDAAPTMIKTRMYLPIELLTRLTASDKK